MAGELWFWVQKQIAETVVDKLRLMSPEQFHEVAWRHVHDAVLKMPRMFQIWACRQVTNIAGVNRNLTKYMKDQCSKCPSCDVEEETCHHVICCNKEGRGFDPCYQPLGICFYVFYRHSSVFVCINNTCEKNKYCR